MIFLGWLRDTDEPLETLKEVTTCSVAWAMQRNRVVWMSLTAGWNANRTMSTRSKQICEAPFGVQALSSRPRVEDWTGSDGSVWDLLEVQTPTRPSAVMWWLQLPSGVPLVMYPGDVPELSVVPNVDVQHVQAYDSLDLEECDIPGVRYYGGRETGETIWFYGRLFGASRPRFQSIASNNLCTRLYIA